MLNPPLQNSEHDLDEDSEETVEVLPLKRPRVLEDVVYPIFELPKTVLALLPTFLSPHEALKLSLRGHLFYAMVNQPWLWRHYISVYFSHIHNEKEAQIAENPKALFIHYYQCLINLLYPNPLSQVSLSVAKLFILDALRGEIPTDEELMGPQVMSTLAKLNAQDSYDLAQGLLIREKLLAVAQGNGHAIQDQLLEQTEHLADTLKVYLGNRSNVDRQKPGVARAFLKGSAASGYLNPPSDVPDEEWLAKLANEISLLDEGNALNIAAFGNHLQFVEWLLYEGNNIHEVFKLSSAKIAAQKGYASILGLLLPDLRDGSISDLCCYAAETGQLEIVRLLVEQHNIRVASKLLAIRLAKEKKHPHVASFILENCGHELGFVDTIISAGVLGAFKYYSSRIKDGMQLIHPHDLYEVQPMQVEPIEDDELPLLVDVVPEDPIPAAAPVLMLSQHKRLAVQEENVQADESMIEPVKRAKLQ